MSDPIVNALSIAREALKAALSPLVPNFQGAPACYWKWNIAGTVGALQLGELSKLLIYQSQDGGGDAALWLGSQGWTGLVTIRCISADLATAEALQAALPAALTTLSAPAVTIRADHVRPLDLPTVDGVHTVASIYRITIAHEE